MTELSSERRVFLLSYMCEHDFRKSYHISDLPIDAVMVSIDHSCGSAKTELCEVAGIELSTAPKRAANSKTVVTRMSWVPYGERVLELPQRDTYLEALGFLLHESLLPELEAAESRTQHLNKVCYPASCVIFCILYQ